VTFAEFRDRRKIFDIEAYSRQPFKAETIAGMEPQQRFPDSRPNSNFGGRDSRAGNSDFHSRDRKFGGASRAGGFDQADGRSARAGFSYERKGGFNDRFAGARHEGTAPHGDFGPRKPAFGKPMGVRSGNGGKVFVPRDTKRRLSRSV
jgi:hypothetical protein